MKSDKRNMNKPNRSKSSKNMKPLDPPVEKMPSMDFKPVAPIKFPPIVEDAVMNKKASINYIEDTNKPIKETLEDLRDTFAPVELIVNETEHLPSLVFDDNGEYKEEPYPGHKIEFAKSGEEYELAKFDFNTVNPGKLTGVYHDGKNIRITDAQTAYKVFETFQNDIYAAHGIRASQLVPVQHSEHLERLMKAQIAVATLLSNLLVELQTIVETEALLNVPE